MILQFSGLACASACCMALTKLGQPAGLLKVITFHERQLLSERPRTGAGGQVRAFGACTGKGPSLPMLQSRVHVEARIQVHP